MFTSPRFGGVFYWQYAAIVPSSSFLSVEILQLNAPGTKAEPRWFAYPEPQPDFIHRPRHVIESRVISVDDDPAVQNFDQYAFIASLIFEAANLHIDIPGPFVNAFPGDHYRLLAALVKLFKPRLMVDIGTFTGLSARVMGEYSNEDTDVITYDVVPYNQIENTVLSPEICKKHGIQQKIEDLADPYSFHDNADLLASADLIMCDGPKDNKFEPAFLEKLSNLTMPCKKRWLLIDDIRFLDMLPLWRAIQSPKIDLTSFGHFSGTGLVDISNGFILKA